jgi:hypothetical protein
VAKPSGSCPGSERGSPRLRSAGEGHGERTTFRREARVSQRELGATCELPAAELVARMRLLSRAKSATALPARLDRPQPSGVGLARGVGSRWSALEPALVQLLRAGQSARQTWARTPLGVRSLLALPPLTLAVVLVLALGGEGSDARASGDAVEARLIVPPEPAPSQPATRRAPPPLPVREVDATRLDPGVSRERAAADAVAEGRYPAAAQLYAELARESPGRRAYREAARILSARAGRTAAAQGSTAGNTAAEAASPPAARARAAEPAPAAREDGGERAAQE